MLIVAEDCRLPEFGGTLYMSTWQFENIMDAADLYPSLRAGAHSSGPYVMISSRLLVHLTPLSTTAWGIAQSFESHRRIMIERSVNIKAFSHRVYWIDRPVDNTIN
jgi:hypothetical protein